MKMFKINIGIILIGTLLGTSVANAQSTPLFTGDGVPMSAADVALFKQRATSITAGTVPAMNNVQYFLRKGSHIPSGQCKYSTHSVLSKDAPANLAYGEQPVAEDPTTCEEVIERGSMPISSLETLLPSKDYWAQVINNTIAKADPLSIFQPQPSVASPSVSPGPCLVDPMSCSPTVPMPKSPVASPAPPFSPSGIPPGSQYAGFITIWTDGNNPFSKEIDNSVRPAFLINSVDSEITGNAPSPCYAPSSFGLNNYFTYEAYSGWTVDSSYPASTDLADTCGNFVFSADGSSATGSSGSLKSGLNIQFENALFAGCAVSPGFVTYQSNNVELDADGTIEQDSTTYSSGGAFVCTNFFQKLSYFHKVPITANKVMIGN